MAYTVEEANLLLADIKNESQLRGLISQLDINSSGSLTLLYGGGVVKI